MTLPRSILDSLLRDDPGRPRLTWYGADGERIELSARVFENWVAKAANLLVEEADLGPGAMLRLDLPAGHWRAAYWAMATWSCGATLRLDADVDADVLVTSDAAVAAAAPDPLRVLVTPAALARAHPGGTPPGVLDEAAEIATYGDRFVPPQPPRDGDPALVAADGRLWPYATLVEHRLVDGVRRHIDATKDDVASRLRLMLAAWAAHGSVVVTTGGGMDALQHILDAEGVDEVDDYD